MSEKYLIHYGVSKLDGAPGRGSGRYALGSGKDPRALIRTVKEATKTAFHLGKAEKVPHEQVGAEKLKQQSEEERTRTLQEAVKAYEEAREQEAAAKEAAKEEIIEKGTPAQLKEIAGQLTQEDMDRALRRMDFEKKLSELDREESEKSNVNDIIRTKYADALIEAASRGASDQEIKEISNKFNKLMNRSSNNPAEISEAIAKEFSKPSNQNNSNPSSGNNQNNKQQNNQSQKSKVEKLKTFVNVTGNVVTGAKNVIDAYNAFTRVYNFIGSKSEDFKPIRSIPELPKNKDKKKDND